MRNGSNQLAIREFPIPLPRRMTTLAVDKRGYPVPAFVAWFNGEPDFRVVDHQHMQRCVYHRRCWICGEPTGAHMAFVIGPMCCINRISSEPPSHVDCAEFAAQACPFLSQPLAKRPDMARKPVPGKTVEPAGIMLAHNPGVCAVWVTKTYKPFRAPGPAGSSGVLFEVGPPERLAFWAKGRHATRPELDDAIAKGLPHLTKMAQMDGEAALAELRKQVGVFWRLLDDALPQPENDLPNVDLSSFEATR